MATVAGVRSNACTGKFLVILNAMLHNKTRWQTHALAPSPAVILLPPTRNTVAARERARRQIGMRSLVTTERMKQSVAITRTITLVAS
jgi:hypothetical protein